MKKVIIAIDYNPCAQKVVEAGYAHAKEMNAEICIVHSVADIAYNNYEYSPLMGFPGFSIDGIFRNIEEQKKEAGEFLMAVVNHLKDENIKTQVIDGRTADAILEFAGKWKADLLIMGAQSHNGFEKELLGEVVANVLKQANIPVLIIPTGNHEPDHVGHEKSLYLHG